jgi:hypothetical protein
LQEKLKDGHQSIQGFLYEAWSLLSPEAIFTSKPGKPKALDDAGLTITQMLRVLRDNPNKTLDPPVSHRARVPLKDVAASFLRETMAAVLTEPNLLIVYGTVGRTALVLVSEVMRRGVREIPEFPDWAGIACEPGLVREVTIPVPPTSGRTPLVQVLLLGTGAEVVVVSRMHPVMACPSFFGSSFLSVCLFDVSIEAVSVEDRDPYMVRLYHKLLSGLPPNTHRHRVAGAIAHYEAATISTVRVADLPPALQLYLQDLDISCDADLIAKQHDPTYRANQSFLTLAVPRSFWCSPRGPRRPGSLR